MVRLLWDIWWIGPLDGRRMQWRWEVLLCGLSAARVDPGTDVMYHQSSVVSATWHRQPLGSAGLCRKAACSALQVSRPLCTRTHPFNGPFSGTTRVSRCQEGKTNLDFTEARNSEWHQLGHMQVCTLLQTDNHASTPPLCFLQAGCPSCRPTSSVKALKSLSRPLHLFVTEMQSWKPQSDSQVWDHVLSQ